MTKHLIPIIRWASWGYLLIVLVLWLMVSTVGDRWWPATFVLFAPRWIVALPLTMLLPLAGWRNRNCLIPLLIGAMVVFGPFMELNLPFGKTAASSGKSLRVLTCNIDNGNCDLNALAVLILEVRADIVALQECPREINLKLKLSPNWYFVQDGELAVLSRYPLRNPKTVQALHPPHKWPRNCLLQCTIQVPSGELVFNAVHLPSPRYGLQTLLDRTTLLNLSRKGLLLDEMDQRWQTARNVKLAVASQTLPVIMAGDFNMPTSSSIYREVWGSYSNAFSKSGLGYGWTQGVNVRGLPVRVRIDHILTDNKLDVSICEVGPDVGSDHLPLIADIEMVKR